MAFQLLWRLCTCITAICGLNNSNTGLLGSNSSRSMNVCPRLPVLCCPVKVQALRWADHLPKISFQVSGHNFRSLSVLESQSINLRKNDSKLYEIWDSHCSEDYDAIFWVMAPCRLVPTSLHGVITQGIVAMNSYLRVYMNNNIVVVNSSLLFVITMNVKLSRLARILSIVINSAVSTPTIRTF